MKNEVKFAMVPATLIKKQINGSITVDGIDDKERLASVTSGWCVFQHFSYSPIYCRL